jgi:cytochrome c peroxidase
LNDGNYDTYKLVPTLRGVTTTGPWTWHGWQTSLPASVKKSLQTTLSTQHDVTKQDVETIMAYLARLKHPRSPHQRPGGGLTKQAMRGKLLFAGRAACADCHQGNSKTSADTYTVGLESNRYFYREFNPPSLSGLHTRRRFLHDGRADTLKEVLTRHHQPEKLTGEKMTAEELADLIAYLKSL